MLYPPDFDQNAIEDEQNALLDLTRWLSQRGPAVRHVYVPNLNFDTCFPIFHWALEDPNTDLATIAAVFWLLDPAYHARRIKRGEPACESGESYELVREIIAKVERGYYPKCRFGFDEEIRQTIDLQRAALAEVGAPPFVVPAALQGPFDGDLPIALDADTPEKNAELWDMLHALGMWYGPRPGSEEAKYVEQHDETREGRNARLVAGAALFGFAGVMACVAYWLSYLADTCCG